MTPCMRLQPDLGFMRHDQNARTPQKRNLDTCMLSQSNLMSLLGLRFPSAAKERACMVDRVQGYSR